MEEFSQLFCKVLHICICLITSSCCVFKLAPPSCISCKLEIRLKACIFWQKHLIRGVRYFLLSHIKGHIHSRCLTVGEAKFDYLVEEVTVNALFCGGALLALCFGSNLRGYALAPCEYPLHQPLFK